MTTEILLWAVRDRTTDMYLPAGGGHNGRGSTYQRLKTFPNQHITVPRLFPTKENAERCLRVWLRGIYDGDSDGEGSRYWSKIVRQPDRIPENMEIVQVKVLLNA